MGTQLLSIAFNCRVHYSFHGACRYKIDMLAYCMIDCTIHAVAVIHVNAYFTNNQHILMSIYKDIHLLDEPQYTTP